MKKSLFKLAEHFFSFCVISRFFFCYFSIFRAPCKGQTKRPARCYVDGWIEWIALRYRNGQAFGMNHCFRFAFFAFQNRIRKASEIEMVVFLRNGFKLFSYTLICQEGFHLKHFSLVYTTVHNIEQYLLLMPQIKILHFYCTFLTLQ